MKSLVFRLEFHWNLFLGIQQWVSIGSGNVLAPNRRQAITWTNAYPAHWRIYAALVGDVINTKIADDISRSIAALQKFQLPPAIFQMCKKGGPTKT